LTLSIYPSITKVFLSFLLILSLFFLPFFSSFSLSFLLPSLLSLSFST
jgi:hypothetical protein